MSKKYTVASVFSGCGGLDLGFIQQGFKVIWANDFFVEAVGTYRRNIGKHIVYGDITNIPSSEIPDKFDVFLGGFPCQGFSISNNGRNMKDKRNFLYLEMLRIIKDKKPKFFVAENVKGLLSMEGGRVINMIMEDFRKLGYKTDYKLLKASNYGVPQNRERVIIIGNRLNLVNIFPKITHGIPSGLFNKDSKPLVTVRDAVGYLENVELSEEPINHKTGIIYNHVAAIDVCSTYLTRKYKFDFCVICDYLKYWKDKKGLSTKEIKLHFKDRNSVSSWFKEDSNIAVIPNKEDWLKLKKVLKFDNKHDKVMTTMIQKNKVFESQLRVNPWNRPASTVLASNSTIHPNRKRRMSVRENAVVQTFPKDYIFNGSLENMQKQVGNAVPVLFANKIAEVIKMQLDGIK